MISPPRGSTLPGAEAAHVNRGVGERTTAVAGFGTGSELICVTVQAMATAMVAAAIMLITGVRELGIGSDLPNWLAHARTVLGALTLLADNQTILDAHDTVGEVECAWIMGNGQHRSIVAVRNFGEQAHDRLAVLAVECRCRLIGENDGRRSGKGARDGNALLLAAAHVARIGLAACARGLRW